MLSPPDRSSISLISCPEYPFAALLRSAQGYEFCSSLAAAVDKASSENERCACLLRDADGAQWTCVQIAGLIARRIKEPFKDRSAGRAEPGDKSTGRGISHA